MPVQCPNCQNDIIGKYCHHCGQTSNVRRVTWGYLLTEFQNRFFGFDNRFLRTMKDLTIHPEVVIQSMIDGIKVRYFGPLSYYFLLITIYVLVVSMLDVDMAAFSESISQAMNGQEQREFQKNLSTQIFSNFRVWSFIMIPFFTLATYLVFRNKRYNFLETSILAFYAMGHPMILSIIMLVIFKYSGFDLGNLIMTGVSYTYYAWVCSRFYNGNGIWNFVKGWLALALTMALLMVISVIIVIIALLLFPDFREQFVPSL